MGEEERDIKKSEMGNSKAFSTSYLNFLKKKIKEKFNMLDVMYSLSLKSPLKDYFQRLGFKFTRRHSHDLPCNPLRVCWRKKFAVHCKKVCCTCLDERQFTRENVAKECLEGENLPGR